MRRHRIEQLSFLIAAPLLLAHCSTGKEGGNGNDNSSGNAGSVTGGSGGGAGSGGSSTSSGGTSNGGRAAGGTSGTGESGSSDGGDATGGDATGGIDSGGSSNAGSGGSPEGGLAGVGGRSEGGQGGVATGGAGAGSGGANPGGAGGQGGAAGNAGGAGGRAGGGAGGVGGVGGSGGGGVGGSSGAGGSAGAAGSAGSGGGFTCNPACGASQMCCPSNALTTSCVAATTAGCLAPDLTVSVERAQRTATVGYRNFAANHCALAEQCIAASGRRRLLRFETFTPNIGTADMRLGVPNTSNPVFEYSACHDHFHFKGYAEYDLLDANGTVVATGHKQAFCLLDTERYVTNDSTVRRTPQFQCGNQGISRGWGDSYTPNLDCQWVDVTDVPPGDYILRIRINQARTLLELRYDNNEALVPVTIP